VSKRPNGAVFRQIRTLFNVGAIGDLTDAQLLERFTTLDREAAELAFAALIERHGPMVLRVCRSLLPNPHDAEDAFQATFLILVQKARCIWVKDSLAPWLHRVAQRVASRVRASTVRRREHERRAAERKPTLVYDDNKTEGLFGLLHQEIDRLPERYRVAFVLCDLEGLSHERAARQLGWPVGTVKSRLARARQLLRSRLNSRGLASPTILLITEAATSAVDAAVSLRMVESTLRAALLMAKAPAVGVISVRVATLAQEVLKTMFLTKLKLILAPVLITFALAAGTASVLGRQGNGSDPRSAADLPKSRRSDITQPATDSGSAEAPAFIKQSRGMIIGRLEQELALAKSRLERTLRRVHSPNDPAAVQGRKTVDEIEGLLVRIDGVLVDAVDRFPTMFDFSGSPGDLGSASPSPNSGTLLPINVNDVYQSSSKKLGDWQNNTPIDQGGGQNGNPSTATNQDGQNKRGDDPFSTETNKDGQNERGNDPFSRKTGDDQETGQTANQNGKPSNETNKDGQNGKGYESTNNKPGDSEAKNNPNRQAAAGDVNSPNGDRYFPNQQPTRDQSAQRQDPLTENPQDRTQSQQQKSKQSHQQNPGANQQQNAKQSQQQNSSWNQQQKPNQSQTQRANQQTQARSANNQSDQRQPSQSKQQSQQQNPQQPAYGSPSNTPREQSSNPGSRAKSASPQPSQSQQSSQPKPSQSQQSQSQSQQSQSQQSQSQSQEENSNPAQGQSGSQGSTSKASGSQDSGSQRAGSQSSGPQGSASQGQSSKGGQGGSSGSGSSGQGGQQSSSPGN
jgi:RNA polymerase sigma factor (sigma-70 family)